MAHGPYPKELPSLVPAVLKSVPVDFIDGEPLRYRLCAGSEFVLYSTGLDCVDDGGEFNTSRETPGVYPRREPADGPDLIWPRAATDAEMQAFQLARARAEQERQATAEREAAEFEKEAEERRQEVIAELAGIYARGETPKLADPRIEGALLSEVLRNQARGGPPLRLEQMLTLRQITTGEEPDIVTFELPLSYEVVTKLGSLRLLCDADPTEEFSNEGAELQECVRAINGNCRLVWNTTYDPPGRHFLQAQLSIERGLGLSRRRGAGAEETTLKGPLFSFVSTNVLQFFLMADVYSEKGAYFRVRLAQPIGSSPWS